MDDKPLRKRPFARNSEFVSSYKEHFDRNAFPNRRDNDYKTNMHRSNFARKGWDNNKTGLVRDQFNCEYSNRNYGNMRYNPCRWNQNYGNLRKSQFLKNSYTGWFSVYVPNVNNHEEVIKIIQAYIAPIAFYPYNKQCGDNSLKFLVDDYKIANILFNANYKLTLKNNQKLIIRVFPYTPTHTTISFTPVSGKVKEKMTEAMITRYNSDTKCMDLSQFHACPLFTENQLFVPLNRPAVLLAALNLIAQLTKHNLYSLSLENNNIYLGEGFVCIRRLFPELKELNLAGNKLNDFKDLKSLTGYTIEVLNLSRNPICNTNHKESYNLTVQELFPVLNKLDNIELPYRYSNFIESKLKFPINLGNSYPVPNGHDPKQPNPVVILVESFIRQYYEWYDNKVSKQCIKNAYCENATFSISADYLSNISRGTDNFEQYIKKNHFLKSDHNITTKKNVVYKNIDHIINFLEKLPKTKHDFGSFVIDVPLANSKLVQIVVNGVFNEIGHKQDKFKSFCRTFCIVPVGKGWRISNDIMFVTLVSDELLIESSKRFYVSKLESEQLKKYDSNSNNVTMHMDVNKMVCMKTTAYQEPTMLNHPSQSYQQPKFSSQQLSTYQSNLQSSIIENQQKTTIKVDSAIDIIGNKAVALPPNISFPMINIKPPTTVHPNAMHTNIPMVINTSNSVINNNPESELIMVKNFSKESGMNFEWSKKCLVDNNWDYKKSFLCFTQLKPCIPAIAFIHTCNECIL